MQSPPFVASERPTDHRRHARVTTTWPVTVQTGDRLLHLQTLNLSALGAKVGLEDALLRDALEVGRPAHLRLQPPGAEPLEIEAILWRTDADGPAFFFIGTPSHAG